MAREGSPHRVPCPLRTRLKFASVLQADLAQPLGLELLLRQGHAAVEHLRIAADTAALEIEPTDAVESHARTIGLGTLGLEAEAITCIPGVAAERGIEELPAKVAPALGEVRKVASRPVLGPKK